jgi:hypothetical protein
MKLAAGFDRVRRPIELRVLTGRRFEALGYVRRGRLRLQRGQRAVHRAAGVVPEILAEHDSEAAAQSENTGAGP